MSENNNSEQKDASLANLVDGESVIPHPLLEKYEEAVKENKDKQAKKAEELKDNNVISSENSATSPNLAVVPNEENVIGSSSANKKEAVKPKSTKEKETVAIYSTRNVTWSEVGKVYRGYNIVSKEAAKKWATRDHIRIATPEEVARDFGK